MNEQPSISLEAAWALLLENATPVTKLHSLPLCSAEDLAVANGKTALDVIHPGDVLKVPQK